MNARIELDGGILTTEMLVERRGPYAAPANIGHYRFFVTYIDHELRTCVWDGPSYDGAIVTAEQARAQLYVAEPVHDWVVDIVDE